MREMGDDEKYSNSKETARVMLQIYHERNNHLANMLIALNGFILAFIAGMLTFVGSTFFSSPQCVIFVHSCLISSDLSNSDKFIPLVIAINVVAIVMILWRFYAHYIDNDIVEGYKKIIRCEHNLGIHDDDKVSLLYSLENVDNNLGLKRLKSYEEIESRKLSLDKKFEEKMKIIDLLTKRKKMGYRGHYWFNVLTIFVISALLVIEAISLKFFIEDKIVLFIIGIFGLLLVVVVSFYCDLCQYLIFLSKDNKVHFTGYLIRIFFLTCITITFSFLISLNWENLYQIKWTIFLFAFKDIFIFMILAYLVFCYAHKDPTGEDIESAIK